MAGINWLALASNDWKVKARKISMGTGAHSSTKDQIVPFRLEKKLFEELPQPKILWIVPGGGHLSAFTRFGDSFKPKFLEFLDEHRR